nr:mucin-2-like [Camelus dromedarius]
MSHRQPCLLSHNSQSQQHSIHTSQKTFCDGAPKTFFRALPVCSSSMPSPLRASPYPSVVFISTQSRLIYSPKSRSFPPSTSSPQARMIFPATSSSNLPSPHRLPPQARIMFPPGPTFTQADLITPKSPHHLPQAHIITPHFTSISIPQAPITSPQAHLIIFLNAKSSSHQGNIISPPQARIIPKPTSSKSRACVMSPSRVVSAACNHFFLPRPASPTTPSHMDLPSSQSISPNPLTPQAPMTPKPIRHLPSLHHLISLKPHSISARPLHHTPTRVIPTSQSSNFKSSSQASLHSPKRP